MDPVVGSTRRLAVLANHLNSSSSSGASENGLWRQETASAVRSLPKFDTYIMETYLDDLREMKRQVYDLFKFKPELLPGPELSKGERAGQGAEVLVLCTGLHSTGQWCFCFIQLCLVGRPHGTVLVGDRPYGTV